MLSANVLAKTDFFTSAFPAEYGNGIAGVFDLRFRKGNNQKRETTIDAGVLGLGFSTEGYFSKKSDASYLVNYRYSTVGLLENFGVKLTNRAGTIKTGNQIANDVHTTCYYPSYQFLVDWNGDIFLCPQDWQRRQTMGNMMQEEVFDIWTSKIMKKYRVDLLKGKRCNNPCNSCNAQGTLLGVNHAQKWREIYKS